MRFQGWSVLPSSRHMREAGRARSAPSRARPRLAPGRTQSAYPVSATNSSFALLRRLHRQGDRGINAASRSCSRLAAFMPRKPLDGVPVRHPPVWVAGWPYLPATHADNGSASSNDLAAEGEARRGQVRAKSNFNRRRLSCFRPPANRLCRSSCESRPVGIAPMPTLPPGRASSAAFRICSYSTATTRRPASTSSQG